MNKLLKTIVISAAILVSGFIISDKIVSAASVINAVNGGTNVTTYTKGDILYSNATFSPASPGAAALTNLPIGSSNFLLTVQSNGVPGWGGNASITANFEVTGYASASQFYAQSGTLSNPGYSFGNDPDTGIYRAGANAIGIVGGGSAIQYNGSAFFPENDSTRNLGIALTNRWLNYFGVNASLSNNFEVNGTASVSAAFIQSGVTASSSFSGSLKTLKGFTANSYQGGGLTGCLGGNALQYSAGQFSCAAVSGSGISAQSGVAAGQATFFQSSSVVSGSNQFFWDTANKRLGIGTTSPTSNLHNVGSTNLGGLLVDSSGFLTAANTATFNSAIGGSFTFGQLVTGAVGTLYGGNSNAFTRLRWNTSQTPDTFSLETGSTGNTVLIHEIADEDFDFAHAQQTDPTLFIHSHNQSTLQWVSLSHNGTIGILNAGVPAASTARIGSQAHLQLQQDKQLTFGGDGTTTSAMEAGFPGFLMSTANTPDALYLGAGSQSNSVIMGPYNGPATDFAHAQQNNPTLFIQSNSLTTNQWIGLAHDQTNGVISTGIGGVVFPNGNIGIGMSTSAQTKFEVQGTASASNLVITGSAQIANNAATVAYSRFGTSATTHANWISTAGDLLLSNDLEGRGSISFAGPASLSNTLFTNTNANKYVGINTNNPGQRLDVVGNSGEVTRSAVESGSTFISYGTDPSAGAFFGWNSGQFIRFAAMSNTSGGSFSEIARFSNSGASVSTNFEAGGYASVGGNISASYPTAGLTEDALCTTGAKAVINRNSGSPTCTVSSARYKHDIQPLNVGLAEILSLKPKSFIPNGKTQPELGFLAEDVEKIDPRLVFYEADGKTPRGVRYEELSAPLAQAVQELKAQVDDQQKQINELKKGQGNNNQENQVWIIVIGLISVSAFGIALLRK